ncbi:MAG: hypothetical protein SOZ17_03200 [Agathobacter sp.]|nr:hypothetical protein [Agathobacter sp.]
MSTISGYDSSSIGVLFSSLNPRSSGLSSAGVSDMLGISYSDYATIRNGSYGKLVKAYYKQDGKVPFGDAVNDKAEKEDSEKELSSIIGESKNLQSSLEALMSSKALSGGTSDSDDSEQKEVAWKEVSSFVKSFNSLMDKTENSGTSGVKKGVESLIQLTTENSKALKSIGITIGKDNQLTIKEEDYKKADLSKVKNLFYNKGGYGYRAYVQAKLIETRATTQKEKESTYGKRGTYTYNENQGVFYNQTT